MTVQTEQQITSHILMVRPAQFGFNEETAESNAFQKNDGSLTPPQIRRKARAEFDNFVQLLRASGVQVTVVEDTDYPIKTDAVFPNNWVTFHQDGTVITYPMHSEIRRLERREDILENLSKQFKIGRRVHLESAEPQHKFLEGTGSMILDRPNRLVYACISPRTDVALLDEFCKITGFEKVAFTAVDGSGKQIYHTNVMMALGETFVVICLDSVRDEAARAVLMEK
ncbi:MAG: arginine deiminase-related protein, partial [Saprospiraceae bacterium]